MLKEILFHTDSEKLERMKVDFSVYNSKGVKAAEELIKRRDVYRKRPFSIHCTGEVFDWLIEKIEI